MSSAELDALAVGARHLWVCSALLSVWHCWRPPPSLAGKYFQLAAFVMLIYDHSMSPLYWCEGLNWDTTSVNPAGWGVWPMNDLTLRRSHSRSISQVDKIWSRKFSGVTILFLINRYITPLQFIIILDGPCVLGASYSVTNFALLFQSSFPRPPMDEICVSSPFFVRISLYRQSFAPCITDAPISQYLRGPVRLH